MSSAPLDPRVLVQEADSIARLARSLLADPDRAADATQETLRLALERGPRPGFGPAAWLRGVLRNVVRRFRRAEVRRWARERAAAVSEMAPSQAATERLAQRRAVIEAVLTLPEDLRTAVELRFFEGLPPRRIGRRLGIPTETARSRVRRALGILRSRLDQRAGGDGRRWALALVPVALRGEGAFLGTASATTNAARLGGFLMAAKTKTALVAMLLLLLGAAAWFLMRDPQPKTVPSPETSAPSQGQSPSVALEPGSGRGLGPAADAPPPSVPRLLVTGLVTDTAGRPLTGVAIHVSGADQLDDRTRTPDVVTGGDGRFRVEREGPTLAWRISASTSGRRSAWATASVGAPRDVVLRLARSVPLWLVVVDESSGKPVEGARVVLTSADEGGTSVVRTVTDTEGVAEVEESGLRPMNFECIASLIVSAPGYAPRRLTLDTHLLPGTTLREHPHRVALVPASPLRVRVTDAAAQPVADASVRGWSGGWSAGHVSGGSSLRGVIAESPGLGPARTDAEGEASLGVPLDPWYLHATHGSDAALVIGSGIPRTAVPVRLAPGITVEGTVVGADGLPAAEAPVAIDWFSWFVRDPARDRIEIPPPGLVAAFTVRTGPDGSFSIPHVPRRSDGRSFWVSAQTEGGYGSAMVEAAPDVVRVVVRMTLAQRRTVGPEFLVRDEAGVPVAGALVEVPFMNPAARTDAAGRARLEIDQDTVVARGVRVKAPAYATAIVAGADVRMSGPNEVVLEGEAVLDLVVRAPDGRGVAAAQVAVVLDGTDTETEAAVRERGGLRLLAEWHSDAEGRVRVEGLPRRPIRISAEAFNPNAAASAARVRNRAILALPQPGPAEIVLPRSPLDRVLGRIVEGLVVGEDGQPLVGSANAALQSAELGLNLSAAVTGGRFRFDGVPPGRWQLQVHAANLSMAILADVEVGADGDVRDLRVAAAAPGRIVGRLTAEAGTVVGGIPIQAVDTRGLRHVRGRATTSADGTFEIPGLPPGPYELVLRAPPPPQVPLRAVDPGLMLVAANAAARIELRTAPAARLVLLCEDERIAARGEGAPNIEDMRSKEWQTNVVLEGPSGTFPNEFGFYRGRNDGPWALAPGRYRVAIRRHDWLSAEAEFTVRGSGDVEVRIAFPPKAR